MPKELQTCNISLYDAEMVEMIMRDRPEYFTPRTSIITEYENGPFGQIPHEKTVESSIAECILNTAHAFEIKYGRENAINYVKYVMKKGA